MSFEDDLALAEAAEPYQDEIYQRLWTEDIDIKRHRRIDDEDVDTLDREFHIDVEIRLPNGSRITGQEKALRHEFADFNTFTIEFYQDREKKTPGEFFNICSQFYLHSYWNATKDGFCKWYLIDIFQLMSWLRDRPVSVLETTTRDSTSRANFFYTDYRFIPHRCVYKSYLDYEEIPEDQAALEI